MWRHFKQLDWIMIITVFLLVGVGLAFIYSSSLSKGDFSNFKKQIIFFLIGVFLMFALSFFDWRFLQENSYFILIVYLVLLLSLIGLFFFAPAIRGVKSWYKIGTFSLDPTEFAKIILIIVLAKYFSKKHIEIYQIRHILLSGFYVLLPAILIFLQPDLGSVLILIALWIGILIVAEIRFKQFLILIFCGLLLFIFSWGFLLKDYQKARVLSFLSPNEPLGTSWSQNQAKIAIGSGGVFGKGFGKGSQTQYGFLPEPQTDFIFSVIAEELGLLGVGFLFLLFSVLIWRIFQIALAGQSNFSRLFTTGFIILLISEIFIHIGMNLGLLPIIGISLPLVSYGGSGLIANLMGLGLLLNIKNNL